MAEGPTVLKKKAALTSEGKEVLMCFPTQHLSVLFYNHNFCSQIQFGSVSPQELKLYGSILAILAVIGGADPRPRVGGVVQHDEFGAGTIAEIRKKQVVVLFESHKVPKLCPLSQLKSVGRSRRLE